MCTQLSILLGRNNDSFYLFCWFSQNNAPASPSIRNLLQQFWKTNDCVAVKIHWITALTSVVFTKLLLENTLAVRPYNYEAVSEQHLPKVAHCIPVLRLGCIGKCAARVLMRSWFLPIVFVVRTFVFDNLRSWRSQASFKLLHCVSVFNLKPVSNGKVIQWYNGGPEEILHLCSFHKNTFAVENFVFFKLCPGRFQALPGNPEANFQNLSNPDHPGRLFCQITCPWASLIHFILINFTFSHPFQGLNH